MRKWLRKWLRKENKSKCNWKSYHERDRVLTELGYTSYADYLASDLWSEIRLKRLSTQSVCSCCDSVATLVHHDAYYRSLLLGDDLAVERDLYPLCNACHYRVEFDGTRKRSSGEAVRQFRRMLYRHRHGRSKSEMIRQKIALKREQRNLKREKIRNMSQPVKKQLR